MCFYNSVSKKERVFYFKEQIHFRDLNMTLIRVNFIPISLISLTLRIVAVNRNRYPMKHSRLSRIFLQSSSLYQFASLSYGGTSVQWHGGTSINFRPSENPHSNSLVRGPNTLHLRKSHSTYRTRVVCEGFDTLSAQYPPIFLSYDLNIKYSPLDENTTLKTKLNCTERFPKLYPKDLSFSINLFRFMRRI